MTPFRFARLAPLAALVLVTLASASAQPSAPAPLTLEKLFASPEFFGESFTGGRWADAGAVLRSVDTDAAAGTTSLVELDLTTDRRRTLLDGATLRKPDGEGLIAVEDYAYSADGTKALLYTDSEQVWRLNTAGIYYTVDLASGEVAPVADRALGLQMFAKFSPDGRQVAFVRNRNVFVVDLATRQERALTTNGAPGTVINGTFDWVYEEEFGLRNGFRWSPDGAQVAYWRLDASGVRDFLLVNNTDSLYSYTTPVQYPKAGETNSAARVGVVAAAGGPTRWFTLSDDERNHYPARMDWAASSTELVIQHLDRPQQRNEVLLADTRTMTTRPVLVETDSAWTDAVDDLVWFDDGRRFTWLSDRDGWQLAYVVSRDGSDVRAVTPAGLDVLSVLQIDTDGGWIYFRAAPMPAPGRMTNIRRVLYRTRLDGTETERLTPDDAPGSHSYTLSPGARYAVHSWSGFGSPSQAEVVRLPRHETVRTLTTNSRLRARVGGLQRGRAFFTQLPADDGTLLDAYVMLPPGMDSTRTYPVLMHVYGEPASTTVNDSWGGSGYLWHLMLTQQGYIVASVDGRGTPSPRGREWRKSVYGRVGVQASADQAAAARALAARYPFVDATRVGIWGWSGGGSQTLNSLFRFPDVFALGMSVAPVPDQRLYDTIYQERYSGHPATNPESYRVGSPITYAEGLRGDLLLVYGTGDDNVHYQGTERLVNRLVELNKPFTMMAYPNRSHGISEGEGTTLHVYGLLTRYLQENLPAGPQ